MKVEDIKDLVTLGEFEYGNTWTEEKLINTFEIDLPDLSGNATSIIRNVKTFDLKKLSAYGMINEQLLNVGKCFIQDGELYRVPLISEMSNQIDKYYTSSNRKYKKAEKLRKSFSSLHPVEAKTVNDQVNRITSMRASADKAYQPMV